MIVVAFYTDSPDTSYAAEAKLLRASLDRVGMEHHIEEVGDGGDWYANTAQKPHFIRRMRERHEGPILYVDVDAFVHEDCTMYFDQLAKTGADFGAHWFAGPAKGHDRGKVRDEGWWMLSGTLFFGDTPGARLILDTWIAQNDFWAERGVVDGGGQKQLWWTVTRLRDRIEVKRLPGRFCFVHDKPWAYPNGEPQVIEHTIASREHRGPSLGKTDHSRQKRIAELRKMVGKDHNRCSECGRTR